MDLQIDHVTIAGSNLDQLSQTFSQANLNPKYGGRHSNGATHMSVVGFRDGTYIELISTLNSDAESPWWNKQIHENGGPCAWAIEVDDINSISADLDKRGIIVDGPNRYKRTREDGTVVEWDLTTLGESELGSTLPFLISDRTPRERRVQSTEEVAASPIRGIDTVIIGVSDINDAIKKFQSAFGLSEPTWSVNETLSATIASFSDQPVALAEPREKDWLFDRISIFGTCPIAYLLANSADGEFEFENGAVGSFVDRSVEWLPITEPIGRRYLGVVDSSK